MSQVFRISFAEHIRFCQEQNCVREHCVACAVLGCLYIFLKIIFWLFFSLNILFCCSGTDA